MSCSLSETTMPNIKPTNMVELHKKKDCFQDCRYLAPCLAQRDSPTALSEPTAHGALHLVPPARASSLLSLLRLLPEENSSEGDSEIWGIREATQLSLQMALPEGPFWSGSYVGWYSVPFLALLWASFWALPWMRGQRKIWKCKFLN